MPERRQLLSTFRERLTAVIEGSGLSRTDFALAVGVDRSTLSQLLSDTNRRLPRTETIVAIARWSQISIDWLVGLSNDGPLRTDIVKEQMSLERHILSPHDERFLQWSEEAAGAKIRYVPATLPDLLKTDAVVRHEVSRYATTRPEQKIETGAATLAATRKLENDLECVNSLQGLEGFVRGEGIWRTLSAEKRLAQVDRMIELLDELYPTLRWFLYDGRQRYAAPVTIFGVKRVAVYLGQMYLVLQSEEHVRAFIENFDDLVRSAVVQPNDVTKLLRKLRLQITSGH